MNKLISFIVAGAALSAASVSYAGDADCEHSRNAEAMRGRLHTLEQQVDRLERSLDGTERRALAEANMKRLREALGELRHRDLPSDCRVELMTAMMHAMVRNQQAALAGSPE